jgi:WD40 repeat protein
MNATAKWFRLSASMSYLILAATFAAGQTSKEIPPAAEIKTAVDTLREVYDKEYIAAEKDPKGKKALAQKLFDTAPKRKTSGMVFACYEEARRLAAAGGDVKLSIAAVNALYQRFTNVPRSLFSDTLKQLVLTDLAATDAPPLAQLAKEEAIAALDREDYDGAVELMGVAVTAAKKADDPDLALELRDFRTRLESLKKAFDDLKTKPDDIVANSTLGTYWIFERKKWDIGLKYLAAGAVKNLAEAARKDLAKPKTAKERTSLADLWYKLAGDAVAERKTLFIERAWEWYSAAIVVAEGDDDLKPTERAREIEKTYPNLFNQVYNGHTGAVAGVAITPDGKTLVSIGNDNAVRVWDVAAGKLTKSLEGHASWIGSLLVTPDGTRAITAGGDSIIRIWDLKTGRQADVLEGHVQSVRSLAISADGRYLVSGGGDKSCRLWDLTTRKEIKKFGEGKEAIESVAIAPDGSRILAGNEYGTINVYDAKSGNSVAKFDKHGVAVVYAITVTKDGKTAISGARDKEIQVWEVATGKLLKTLSGHAEQVYQVVLSADEKQVLSASYDKTIRIWDLGSGKELKKYEGHSDGVQGVCYSPDGRMIFSASWDKTIRRWRVPPMLSGSTTPGSTKKVD